MSLRIGLDCDQVICDFINPYLERFGEPKDSYEITRNVTRILIKDREFWMNLPIIHRPNFTPELFCSKRVHPKAWSKRYLKINGIPDAPFYQVYLQTAPKSRVVRNKVDVFIDDSISNWMELNLAGVPCLLMDSQENQNGNPISRIFSLDYEEIEETYHLFKQTIFPNFKNFIYG